MNNFQNKNIIVKGNSVYTIDLINNKKVFWEPTRSKVCAAILKGIKGLEIKSDSKILYLGCAEGYTITHISNIVTDGLVVGIDISAQALQKSYILSKKRKNLIVIMDNANNPENYEKFFDFKFDIIIQDVAQKNQIEILKKNSENLLKNNGLIFLSLKISAISQNTQKTINEEINKFDKYFKKIDYKRLEPFEKKHIFIVGRKK